MTRFVIAFMLALFAFSSAVAAFMDAHSRVFVASSYGLPYGRIGVIAGYWFASAGAYLASMNFRVVTGKPPHVTELIKGFWIAALLLYFGWLVKLALAHVADGISPVSSALLFFLQLALFLQHEAHHAHLWARRLLLITWALLFDGIIISVTVVTLVSYISAHKPPFYDAGFNFTSFPNAACFLAVALASALSMPPIEKKDEVRHVGKSVG
jgi:hypothetical protein